MQNIAVVLVDENVNSDLKSSSSSSSSYSITEEEELNEIQITSDNF